MSLTSDTDRPLRRRGRWSKTMLSIGARNTACAMWSQRMGEFDAPWVPSFETTPEERAAYMITLLAAYFERHDPAFEVFLDNALSPSAVIVRKPGRTASIPFLISGRFARITGAPISLASEGVGPRLVTLLAARCGAFFGEAP